MNCKGLLEFQSWYDKYQMKHFTLLPYGVLIVSHDVTLS